MTARWEEALDAQLDLYKWAASDDGLEYHSNWAMVNTQRSPVENPQQAVPAFVLGAAFNADTFHVDPDMQTLWEAASQTFEPEALRREDLITESGFLYLPRPYHVPDVSGNDVSCRAFLWHSWPEGVVFGAFHRVGDPDFHDEDARKWCPRGTLLLDALHTWAFDRPVRFENGVYDPVVGQGDLRRVVQSLWRLLNQHIAVRTEAQPTRPVRRRMEKAKFPERRITVVTLRRPRQDPDEHDARTVEWSHRWVVQGHWRNQWYPSLGAHRQVWINPFIKGPEELPLITNKARVFALVR